MKTDKNVLWRDPREKNMSTEMEKGREEDQIIANHLADKIAGIVTNSYQNRDIIKNLIANTIRDQIYEYLREYENIVAEDILNSLKAWELGEIKGWTSEIDFEYARHGKLSTFGKELAKEFNRLKEIEKQFKENNDDMTAPKVSEDDVKFSDSLDDDD